MKSYKAFKEICGPCSCNPLTRTFDLSCQYRTICQKYFGEEIAHPNICEAAYEIYRKHSIEAKLEKLLT